MILCNALWLAIGLLGIAEGQYTNDTVTPEGGELEKGRTHPTSTPSACSASTVTVPPSCDWDWKRCDPYCKKYYTPSTYTTTTTRTETCYITIRPSPSISTIYIDKTIEVTVTTTDYTTELSTLTTSYPYNITTTKTEEETITTTDFETSTSTFTTSIPYNVTITNSYGYPVTLTEWSTYTETTTLIVPITSTETTTEISVSNTTVTVPTTTTEYSTSTYTTVTSLTVTESYPYTVISHITHYNTTTYISVSTYTATTTISYPVTETTTETTVSPTTTTETTVSPTTTTETETTVSPTTTTEFETESITLSFTETTTEIETTEITLTLPATTVTTSISGSLTTITLPASTVVSISTLPGETQTIEGPGATVTVTEAAICPAPTNSSPVVPQDTGPNALWGCSPGFVCNVPKPAGCGLWADPPAYDYLCPAKFCVPSPPFNPIAWPPGESSYYPPIQGYFNLNPKAFGLDYGIFVKKVVVIYTIKHGSKVLATLTTGNWVSQASLTHYPPGPTPKLKAREYKTLQKRDNTIVPAVCFAQCNNCYIEAQRVGKSPALCDANSAFQTSYGSCQTCVELNGDSTKVSLQTYVDPQFAPFVSFCEAQAAVPELIPTTSTQTVVPIPATQSVVVATETAATPTITVPITSQITPASETSSSLPPSKTSPVESGTTTTAGPVQFTGISSRRTPPSWILAISVLVCTILAFLI